MATYAIMAQHYGAEREQERFRVGSEAVANALAAKLRDEKFSTPLPGKKRTKPVRRYLSVRVQEVSA